MLRKEQKAKERLHTEEKNNNLMISRFYGKKVHYGEEIMLQHVDSDSFLCASNECSSTKDLGCNIYLTNKSNKRMKFFISPKWSMKNKGDYVKTFDEIYITNVKTNYYLSRYNDSIVDPQKEKQ